jgi:hypothetical protein
VLGCALRAVPQSLGQLDRRSLAVAQQFEDRRPQRVRERFGCVGWRKLGHRLSSCLQHGSEAIVRIASLTAASGGAGYSWTMLVAFIPRLASAARARVSILERATWGSPPSLPGMIRRLGRGMKRSGPLLPSSVSKGRMRLSQSPSKKPLSGHVLWRGCRIQDNRTRRSKAAATSGRMGLAYRTFRLMVRAGA